MAASPQGTGTSGAIMKRYVQVGEQLVHYRECGAGPSVVLLHDSPRSSRLHLQTLRDLGAKFRVVALDTPGYGNSEPLALADPTVEDIGAFLGQTLRALGLERAPLYATHTSAKIALAYVAAGAPTPLLLLDGLSLPDQPASEAFVASYLQPFAPDARGAYLAAEWSHVRDMLRWFPWFDAKPQNRIAMDAPSAEWMADYVIDLFAAGPNYSSAYAPALRYLAMPDLKRVAVPTVVFARSDDVLQGFLDKVPVSENPNLSVARLPADHDAWLDWLSQRLASAADATPETDVPSTQMATRYVDLPHGQLRVHRQAGHGETPMLILGAPTTREALRWAEALRGRCATLVPELPGFGESDPLPEPTCGALAACLAEALDQFGIEHVHVLGLGVASGLAATLAAHRPDLVASVIFDGVPPLSPEAARTMAGALCPEIAFDWEAGSHLHRFWHMLRDSEIQWPWYDRDQSAMRTLPPALDAASLHAALAEIIKQPACYGDAAKAILGASETAFADVTAPTLIFTHPSDPAYREAEALSRQITGSLTQERPDAIDDAAVAACAFLDRLRTSAAAEALL